MYELCVCVCVSHRALTFPKKERHAFSDFLLSLIFGEQTTHERGQMTVTFLQNGCDVTSDQSFAWPDAADVVSSLVFVHMCVCVRERKKYMHMLVLVCACVDVCVHWKPAISQTYQIGQSTSSWLRL